LSSVQIYETSGRMSEAIFSFGLFLKELNLVNSCLQEIAEVRGLPFTTDVT